MTLFVVLAYPDEAVAARIFDDLHRAGALGPRGRLTPAVTVIADETSPPLVETQLKQRMRERGLSGESDLTVVRNDQREA